jgi:hypothetical protein
MNKNAGASSALGISVVKYTMFISERTKVEIIITGLEIPDPYAGRGRDAICG